MVKLLARILSRPRVFNLIVKYAKPKPYFHLDGYMDRWWCLPRCLLAVNKNGHLFPKAWLPFSIRLHHTKTPDASRDLHDHPTNYRTFILKGHYYEARHDKPNRWLMQGQTSAAKAESFHTIKTVSPGGVWTLFVMGRRRNSWGFLVKPENGQAPVKIGWREYLGVPKHENS